MRWWQSLWPMVDLSLKAVDPTCSVLDSMTSEARVMVGRVARTFIRSSSLGLSWGSRASLAWITWRRGRSGWRWMIWNRGWVGWINVDDDRRHITVLTSMASPQLSSRAEPSAASSNSSSRSSSSRSSKTRDGTGWNGHLGNCQAINNQALRGLLLTQHFQLAIQNCSLKDLQLQYTANFPVQLFWLFSSQSELSPASKIQEISRILGISGNSQENSVLFSK